MLHFEFIFVHDVRTGLRLNFSDVYIHFPAPFLEKTVLPPLNYLALLLNIS